MHDIRDLNYQNNFLRVIILCQRVLTGLAFNWDFCNEPNIRSPRVHHATSCFTGAGDLPRGQMGPQYCRRQGVTENLEKLHLESHFCV